MIISVVIPTYRRPPLLLRCLEALLAQSLQTAVRAAGIEIIVVDDGNDQATREAVATLRAPGGITIRYLGQLERRGPAAARNRGWQAAQANFIAFTDDDCIPDKHWLQNGIGALQEGAQVVTGQMRVPLTGSPTEYERTTAFLETAEFVTANCFCQKKALEKVGGLEECFDIAWREDSDLQFKFIRHQIPVIKRPDVIILHPVRQSSWWASLKDERKNKYDALLYKRHPQLFRQRIPAYTGLVRLYYTIVISFVITFLALLAGAQLLASITGMLWVVSVLILVITRLKGTTHTLQHIIQVLLTSLATPFLSVYWRLYGAVKYRVFYM